VNPFVVRHRDGAYRVTVAAGCRADLPRQLAEQHPRARAVVISDATVADVTPRLLTGVEQLTFPAGERHKTRTTWSMLTDELLARHFGRDTVVVALGGGVTTDLAGFVAATFLRGVPWIAVPTTTVGMLDAAIGGKTGVDTEAGKNLVGAFHAPSAVLCDPDLLATLDDRHFREGLAEAVKHAVTMDPVYADWIADHADAIADRDAETLTHLVHRSAELKAAVVTADEHEAGRRAVLNAGHTIGHALEQASAYRLPHGEAVAIGLVLETRLAEAMRLAESGTADRVAGLLAAVQLPVDLPAELDPARIRDAMMFDKKNRQGAVRAALLASWGRAARPSGGEWTVPLDLDAVHRLLH
jgi:3-dehydroquinate synthase